MSVVQKFDQRRCPEVFDNCLAFNLRRADRLLTQIYDEALRPAGIRVTQYSLLVAMRAMEPVTMSALSAQLGLDRTTLTRNLKVLETEGLARSDAGEDLRERHVALTDKGHAALNVAFPLWKAVQNRVETHLGRRALAGLVTDLAQITELPT